MKNRKVTALLLAAVVGVSAAMPAAACCDGSCCRCNQQQSSAEEYWNWKYSQLRKQRKKEAEEKERRAAMLAVTPTEELDSRVTRLLVYTSPYVSISLYGAPRIEGTHIVIPVAVVTDRTFRLSATKITVNGVERDFLLHDERNVTEGTWYTVYDGYCSLFEQDYNGGLLFVGGEIIGDMHVRTTLEINGDRIPLDYQWDGAAWSEVKVDVMTQEGR